MSSKYAAAVSTMVDWISAGRDAKNSIPKSATCFDPYFVSGNTCCSCLNLSLDRYGLQPLGGTFEILRSANCWFACDPPKEKR